MTVRGLMAFLCLALFLTAVGTQGVSSSSSDTTITVLLGFLLGFPVVVGILLWIGVRWAFMVGVMCGTIGLALDISTLVHMGMEPEGMSGRRTFVGLSGLLNFLLIVVGGKGFLKHP